MESNNCPSPERRLQVCQTLVRQLASALKSLHVSDECREVWEEDIGIISHAYMPPVHIGIFGVTGGGKSSLLNAILEDNILPTSCMRACTSVVTTISHHLEPSINAEINFLSITDWCNELASLKADLTDEASGGSPEAKAAWGKVHAVYPLLTHQEMTELSVDDILDRNPEALKLLGSSITIVADDSVKLSKEMHPYIGNSIRRQDGIDPAWWPLILNVHIKCCSSALSTGATLIDLPGTADANAARNSIANNFMKKCDVIWIVAPIARVLDDKVAHDLFGGAVMLKAQLFLDGKYNSEAITFIASKTDDISCDEVTQALDLHGCDEYKQLAEAIDSDKHEIDEQKGNVILVEKLLKGCQVSIKAQELLIKSLSSQNGDLPGKRKAIDFGQTHPSKRPCYPASTVPRCASPPDSEELLSCWPHGTSTNSVSEKSTVSQDLGGEDLQNSLKEATRYLEVLKNRSLDVQHEKAGVNESILLAESNSAKHQMEMNQFCSRKRSEYAISQIRSEFQQGGSEFLGQAGTDLETVDVPVFTCSSREYLRLNDLVRRDGNATCFSTDEDTGIPALQEWCHEVTHRFRERTACTLAQRLLVFAELVQSFIQNQQKVTSLDYSALRKKWTPAASLDNPIEPQDPIKRIRSQKRTRHTFKSEDDIQDTLLSPDKPEPHEIFGSEDNQNQEPGNDDGDRSSSESAAEADKLKYTSSVNRNIPAVVSAKQDIAPPFKSISSYLLSEFNTLRREECDRIGGLVKEDLAQAFKAGAQEAIERAMPNTVKFSNPDYRMHYATYRAILVRHGTFREHDLNTILSLPFTSRMAPTWSTIFSSGLFQPIIKGILESIEHFIAVVVESAVPGLQDCVKKSGECCIDQARIAIMAASTHAKAIIDAEQKDASRSVPTFVRDGLSEGYDLAIREKGKGSLARQKATLENFVEERREEIFTTAAVSLPKLLIKAAKKSDQHLEHAFEKLAKRIEITLSSIWEESRNDPAQRLAYREVLSATRRILTCNDVTSARGSLGM